MASVLLHYATDLRSIVNDMPTRGAGKDAHRHIQELIDTIKDPYADFDAVNKELVLVNEIITGSDLEEEVLGMKGSKEGAYLMGLANSKLQEVKDNLISVKEYLNDKLKVKMTFNQRIAYFKYLFTLLNKYLEGYFSILTNEDNEYEYQDYHYSKLTTSYEELKEVLYDEPLNLTLLRDKCITFGHLFNLIANSNVDDFILDGLQALRRTLYSTKVESLIDRMNKLLKTE